jgi:hypothetical protein
VAPARQTGMEVCVRCSGLSRDSPPPPLPANQDLQIVTLEETPSFERLTPETGKRGLQVRCIGGWGAVPP